MNPWYSIWSNRILTFDRTFDNGGKHLKDIHGDPGKIRLKPRYVTDVNGNSLLASFKIKCGKDEASEALDGLRLAPVGDVPFIWNSAQLPPYKKQYESTYSQALASTVAQLQAWADPGYQRLETLFPVAEGTALFVDIMRVVRIEKAVQGDLPLDLVTFGLVSGTSTNQNGGGSGPPH